MERFKDTREDLYSFQNEFLVGCPFCDSCAIVRCIDPDKVDCFAPRRFSCTACGSSKDCKVRDSQESGGHLSG